MSEHLPEIAEAVPVAEAVTSRARSSSGFSLASLFVLTTVAAVLVAGIAPVGQQMVQGRVEGFWLAMSLGCGFLAGLLIGLILGMHQYHRGYGALLGAGVGGGLGLLTGPLMLLPLSMLQPVALAMFIGSLLMIAAAVLMRPGRG